MGNEGHITRLSAEELRRLGPGETDWAHIDTLADRQIEAAMRDDPDWSESIDLDWSKADFVSPRKKRAISIRLDEDVIAFFKRRGEGYQTRINAVLRHFMEETKKPDAAK